MSLEAAVAENTAALKEVAELLRASNAGREAAVAKIEAAAGGGDAPAAGRKGRTPKNAETTAAAEEPKSTAAPKAATADDLRAAAEKFMQTDDADVKAKRRAFIKSVIEHFPKVETPGFVPAVPAEFYGDAIDWLKTKTANIDSPISFPTLDVSGGEEDDDLDIG